jgi:hypothetical protein
MNPEESANRLLHQAGDQIPASAAPVGQLLREGRRAERRRLVTVVGSAVAVALIAAGGAALAVDDPGPSSSAVRPPEPSTPPGTRLVGMNRVAVAVPIGWRAGRPRCQTSYAETITVGAPAGAGCAMIVPVNVASAMLSADTRGQGIVMPQPTSGGELDRIGVLRWPTISITTAPAGTTVYEGALFVQGRSVAIVVRSPVRAVVDRILRSALSVPDDYRTIPPDPTPQDLRRMGFGVEVRQVYRPGLPQGSLVGTAPSPGSVVAEGAPVIVSLSTRHH